MTEIIHKTILLNFFLISTIFAVSLTDICGNWMTEEKKSIVNIYKAGNIFYGKFVWIADTSYKDSNNPDTALRARSILGIVMLRDFVFNEKKSMWEGGTVYDCRSGKIYKAQMKISSDKKEIYLRGYIGIPVIGRNTTWKRVERKF